MGKANDTKKREEQIKKRLEKVLKKEILRNTKNWLLFKINKLFYLLDMLKIKSL